MTFIYWLGLREVKKILNRINVPIVVKENDFKYPLLENGCKIPNLPFGYYVNNGKVEQVSDTSDSLRIGFIGKLSYSPNCLGLVHFINNIWNPILQNNYKIEMTIAGSGELPVILKNTLNETCNINNLGYVHHLHQFWNCIDVLIVPVNIGGGSNIKISEGLMYGKKIIATPFAARGYEYFVNKGFIKIANNHQEWINAINDTNTLKSISSESICEEAQIVFNLEKWNMTVLNAVKS